MQETVTALIWAYQEPIAEALLQSLLLAPRCDARYLHAAPRRPALFQFFQVGNDVSASLRVVELEEHLGAGH